MNQEYKKLGKMCLWLVLFGFLTSFMDNEAESYVLDVVGGLSIWYIYFGDILGKM